MRKCSSGKCGYINLRVFDVHDLADSITDESIEDREGEATVKHAEHDIHADDIEVLDDEDQNDEEKEDGNGKC